MKYAVSILLTVFALFLVYALLRILIAGIIGMAIKMLFIALVIGVVFALVRMATRKKSVL